MCFSALGFRGISPLVGGNLVGDQPIQDVRGLLDRIARRAGLGAGDLRTKMFRHTYCAARLQTLDRGAPVSTYTVACELGHESEAMVRRVYAHLGEIRHRAEVVDWLTKWLIDERPGQQHQIALTVYRDPAVLGGGVRYRATVPPSEDKLQNEIEELLSRLSTLRPR